MDKSRQFLLWTLGGAGVVLLYAAYKGDSPLSLLESYTSSKSALGSTDTTNTTGVSTGTRGTFTPGTGGTQASLDALTVPDVPDYPSTPTYVTDANGNVLDVPVAYANNPGSYVPSVTA